ncbi:hypothetical protein V1517DRAFT_1201 [Lipomyces orientalis]|uniref:Uncharacterized protein n=1 Tax=Lipomyces orientalis TaxID=1233043 RepID=A0ACC3TYQ2_9ASCO
MPDTYNSGTSSSSPASASPPHGPAICHSMPQSQVNKDGQCVFQPESYGNAFNPTQVQLPMPLQQQPQQQAARVPQPPFTATVPHAHAIKNVVQPTTVNPLYEYPSANPSLAPSPVSSSGSELSSPFEAEVAGYGMWDVNADVTSMQNHNVDLGLGMMDDVDVGSISLDWQMMDECDRTMSDRLLDSLVPSTTPFRFANSSIVEPEYAQVSTATATAMPASLLSSAVPEERRLMQFTTTREESGQQTLAPPPLNPSVTAPVSIATDGPPMMAPGSDASVFLFPGEQGPERPLDEEFLVQRSISSAAPTITQSCTTIAPALLSSSSHSTATMYVHAADVELTLSPRNEVEQGPFLLASLMSPDRTSTPETETTIFSPESPVPTPDERSYDYAADWPSRSIFDVVKTDERRTVQRESSLPRRYPVVPVDVLQRTIGRAQSAKKDERGRTNSMEFQNVMRPGLMEETQTATTRQKFAVVFPAINSRTPTKKAANRRQSESTNASSGQTKKWLGKPPSPKFAAARANTTRPEYDGDSIFVASFPPKRKLSDAGLVELSEPGYNSVVNVNTAETNGPDISVGKDRSVSRPSQRSTGSFSIVIKAQPIGNSDSKTDSNRCQHNFHHPNKRRKIFAGLAFAAVSTLAVGIGATKVFA